MEELSPDLVSNFTFKEKVECTFFLRGGAADTFGTQRNSYSFNCLINRDTIRDQFPYMHRPFDWYIGPPDFVPVSISIWLEQMANRLSGEITVCSGAPYPGIFVEVRVQIFGKNVLRTGLDRQLEVIPPWFAEGFQNCAVFIFEVLPSFISEKCPKWDCACPGIKPKGNHRVLT